MNKSKTTYPKKQKKKSLVIPKVDKMPKRMSKLGLSGFLERASILLPVYLFFFPVYTLLTNLNKTTLFLSFFLFFFFFEFATLNTSFSHPLSDFAILFW